MINFVIVSTCRGGGYRYARTEPLHPRANSNGLYPLHRVLVENMLGRLLGPNEVVHHKDGDKDNNDLSNLQVMDHAAHSAHHQQLPLVPHVCGQCGAAFQRAQSVSRQTLRRSKSGLLFCSHVCSGLFWAAKMKINRGDVLEESWAHNPTDAGSSPAPATPSPTRPVGALPCWPGVFLRA